MSNFKPVDGASIANPSGGRFCMEVGGSAKASQWLPDLIQQSGDKK